MLSIHKTQSFAFIYIVATARHSIWQIVHHFHESEKETGAHTLPSLSTMRAPLNFWLNSLWRLGSVIVMWERRPRCCSRAFERWPSFTASVVPIMAGTAATAERMPRTMLYAESGRVWMGCGCGFWGYAWGGVIISWMVNCMHKCETMESRVACVDGIATVITIKEGDGRL